MIYTLDQHRVTTVGDNFYIAPNATVLGQVELGEDVSVWFGAVIRGDVEKIIIGKGSNIQDLSVLHVDPGSPIIIGENVTVGHKVMLHGQVRVGVVYFMKIKYFMLSTFSYSVCLCFLSDCFKVLKA